MSIWRSMSSTNSNMSDSTMYYISTITANTEQVTYRQLSRAVKVHSNTAKQMLYEFHRKQNERKPGRVHATYLLTGTRRVETATQQINGGASQEEDTPMQSSPPFPGSSAPKPDIDMYAQQALVRSVMLVREEHLETARGLFEIVSGIHIYSLEASSLKDLNVLTECNRRVRADYASEEPLVAWKQYGTIQNPNAKRRTRRTGPPPPPPVATDSKLKATTVAAKKDTPAAVKADSRPSSAKGTPEPGNAAKSTSTSKPAALKRDTSNIFKSFSKAATKPKKQDSASSAETTPAPASKTEKEDEPMTGFSDDEDEDEDGEDAMPTTAATESKKKAAPSGRSKKEREAELQAMMDAEEEEQPRIEKDEDEDMDDAPSPGTPPAVEEAEAAADEKATEPAETVTVENGRRRGRRRVMKKKTVEDEEGYLGAY